MDSLKGRSLCASTPPPSVPRHTDTLAIYKSNANRKMAATITVIRCEKAGKVPESPRKSPKVHLKGYRYFLSTFYKNSSMARRKVKKETNDAQDAPITTTKKQAVCRCRRCTRRQRHRHFSRCFELGSITNLVASPSRRNSDGMYDGQAR